MRRHRHAGIPQFDWPGSGKNDAQRDGLTLPARAHGPYLGSQQFLDAAELVQINVDDFAAILEIVAGVMAAEARAGREIAAAKNVGGLIQVDVTVDVGWDAAGAAVGIVGDEQAHRHMRRPERESELHGGIAADGMADGRDRLGITAVVGNRLVSDAAPARMSVSAWRNTAAIDALRKLVPPPITGSHLAIEQIGPSA